VEHYWFTDRKEEAVSRLERLSRVVDLVSYFRDVPDDSLQVQCWLQLGDWKLNRTRPTMNEIPEQLQAEVLTAYKRATDSDKSSYRSWHSWALLNFRIAQQLRSKDTGSSLPAQSNPRHLRNHIVAAAQGFAVAIGLGTKKWSASVQQDLLNLVTCLFKFGTISDVASRINDAIVPIPIDAWLGVLPQLLARIHIMIPSIRSVLHPLLKKLGEKHPQALMYPLSVLLKSPVAERKKSAESLMSSLKQHSKGLVEEALMVSTELIRVAILWLETFHQNLEDASTVYYAEGNVAGMLDILLPLHEEVEKGANTSLEAEFIFNYGADLDRAHGYLKELVAIGGRDCSQLNGSNRERAAVLISDVWGKCVNTHRCP
jgi:serine/threonine-protein kinase mTOR